MKKLVWFEIAGLVALGGGAAYLVSRSIKSAAAATLAAALPSALPPPHSPLPAPVLPGGFKVGDRVLIDPTLYFNPSLPSPGRDAVSPVLATVTFGHLTDDGTDPRNINLTPLGVPSLPVVVTEDESRALTGGMTKIVPVSSVRKISSVVGPLPPLASPGAKQTLETVVVNPSAADRQNVRLGDVVTVKVHDTQPNPNAFTQPTQADILAMVPLEAAGASTRVLVQELDQTGTPFTLTTVGGPMQELPGMFIMFNPSAITRIERKAET
jgi:hypothetical protein